MNHLNSIVLEGNFVRDPDCKETANGKKVSTFSIANNRYLSKGQGSYEKSTSFFDCECWGLVAEKVLQKGKKGCKVRLIGRIIQNTWEDNKKNKHSQVKVVCEHAEFFDRGNSTDEQNDKDNSDNEAYEEAQNNELTISF